MATFSVFIRIKGSVLKMANDTMIAFNHFDVVCLSIVHKHMKNMQKQY